MPRLIPAALEKRSEAAQARLAEIARRPHSNDTWGANQRDLLAAHAEVLAVYAEAMKVTGLGTGLLWSALYDAQAHTRRRLSEIEHDLKMLGGES